MCYIYKFSNMPVLYGSKTILSEKNILFELLLKVLSQEVVY